VNPPKKQRIFIAIDPPPDWREFLREAQSNIKRRLADSQIKWTDAEQIHITLRFLGYILRDEVPLVEKTVTEACAGSNRFILRCSSLGCFPRSSSPRVLWIGIEDVENALAPLEKKIVQATKAIGKEPEDRPFHPHLTLARIKQMRSGQRKELAKIIESQKVTLESPWQVNDVLVMESKLSPHGARYEVRSRIALGSGD
jgi:2'-5' RNA ligase